MSLEFIKRQQVVEPYVPDYWQQLSKADSVCIDGRVAKEREGNFDRDPNTCQLHVIAGVVQNPFVVRFNYSTGRFDWAQDEQ